MTREEQIKKQADIYTDDASNYAEWCEGGGWVDINDIELIEKAYISGAKWADETMIERACKYLKTHLWQSVDYDNDPIVESVQNITVDNFIKDFKRYLEGEL